MSVPFSFPSVLVRGDLTTRILPGGREQVRSILSAHPAVRAIASDEHLDVAILKRGLTADAYELAAEVRRAVPRDIDANELCGVCVRATNLPAHRWLNLDWNRAKRRGIAWRRDVAPGRVARLRPATALATVLPAAVQGPRPLALVEAAIRELKLFNISLDSDSVYVEAQGPVLLTTLRIIQDAGRLLHMFAYLPVHSSAETRAQTATAIERANATLVWCKFCFVAQDEIGCYRALRLDPSVVTMDYVKSQVHWMLRTAHIIGLSLVKVALGFAEPEEVDAPIAALLAE